MSDIEYKLLILKGYFKSLHKKSKVGNSRSIRITTVGLEHIIQKIEEIENLCK